MLNLHELEEKINTSTEEIHSISQDIVRLEGMLKSSCLSDLSFECEDYLGNVSGTLRWDTNRKRLVFSNSDGTRPLIETKSEIRRSVHRHLKEFVEELTLRN